VPVQKLPSRFEGDPDFRVGTASSRPFPAPLVDGPRDWSAVRSLRGCRSGGEVAPVAAGPGPRRRGGEIGRARPQRSADVARGGAQTLHSEDWRGTSPRPCDVAVGVQVGGSAVRFPRDAHQARRGKPRGFKSVSNLSTCSEQGEHRVDVSEDRHRTGLHAPNPPLPRLSAGSSPHERI
jgi:hypothetical protein